MSPGQNDSPRTSALPWGAALQHRFSLLDDPKQPELLQTPEAFALLQELCDALESGSVRVVQGDGLGGWWVHSWIKRALVLLSGAGTVQPQPGVLPGSELNTLGWSNSRPVDRRVPAGSFIRRGAYIASGATVMPPSSIQAGATILERAIVDSHVLVGTGVLVGEGCVVGCGTMLAGAVMPEEALPVIMERGVIVGGNCGLYGSIVVGERVSIFAGTIIRSAGGVFHATRREWMLADQSGTLRLPPGSMVNMGLPPAESFADGIQRLTPVITD